MSFAVWQTKPPFPEEHLNQGEHIYARESGTWKHISKVKDELAVDQWLVTSDGLPAQGVVDALLNQPAAEKKLTDGALAALLVEKRLITDADVQAATAGNG